MAADSYPVSIRTEYDWDSADNRLSKIVRGIDGSTTSLVSTTTYGTNCLNQMTGYVAETPGLGTTNVVYQYDANGARTNKTETVDDASSFVAYEYDEDNRLIAVSLNAPTNTHGGRGQSFDVCVFGGGVFPAPLREGVSPLVFVFLVEGFSPRPFPSRVCR